MIDNFLYLYLKIGLCRFVNGNFRFGLMRNVGTAIDEQDCARKVQKYQPGASSVTYRPSSKSCYAHYSTDLTPSSLSFSRACTFAGIKF